MKKEKKMSAAKQKIINNYEQQKTFYLAQGFEEKQELISILKANLMAFVTALPFVVIGYILWAMLQKESFFFHYKSFIPLLFAYVALIFVHEVLHGLAWSIGAKAGWKSIYIGMMWESITPYCHCNEPLSPQKYLIGVLTPVIVLGLGFYILAFVTGNHFILWLSMLNTLAGGGDLAISISVLKYVEKKGFLLDHPTDCGFIAFLERKGTATT